MSMLLMVKAMEFKVGNPLRKLVLIKLADNANDKGECFPSHNTIAKACEISRSSVQAHIEALIKMGVVKKINRKKNEKENTSNLYILTIPENGIGGIPEDNTGIPVAGTPIPTDNIGGIPTDEQEPVNIEPVNESKKINKKPMSSGDDEKHQSKINCQSIVDAYNEFLGERLPCVKKISKKRERAIKSFMTERLNKNSLDAAISYFKAFSERAKPFYFGDNKTGWIANFDFVIREDTVIAVREGTISKAEFVG